LRGGVLYHDGQFDDARLAINLAQTAASHGAVLLNYFRMDGLLKKDGVIRGVLATDQAGGAGMTAQTGGGKPAPGPGDPGGKSYEIKARVVINATGVFTDSILQIDQPGSETVIAPSQGVHIILDKDFLPGRAAILVPHTDDGRVLFAVPWHDKIIVGTTDTPVSVATIEPRALPEEIDFILQQIGRYLRKVPGRGDIRSVFAGLRPLVKSSSKKTAELARDHLILVADSGLITITGGKWTTYRRMAEDTVNTAVQRSGLPVKPCITGTLAIHGSAGEDEAAIRALTTTRPEWGMPLHPHLPYLQADIIRGVREELCLTVEDALSRRTRSLLLDAKAAIECAPVVAALLATELGHDQDWQVRQTEAFGELAKGYLA
jgi:glycerol-3-phosphate dehydrogenase